MTAEIVGLSLKNAGWQFRSERQCPRMRINTREYPANRTIPCCSLMAIVVFGAAKSAFETLDLAGRELALPSETTLVCMICDVTPPPAFCGTKCDGTIQSNDRWLRKSSSPTAANKLVNPVAASIPMEHPYRTWIWGAGPMPTLPYPPFLPTPGTWNPNKAKTGRDQCCSSFSDFGAAFPFSGLPCPIG